VAAFAVYTDTRRGMIPNRLTFPAIALAVALHGLAGGWAGVGNAAVGAAAGLGLLIVPFLVGGMGAGDVKLMAALGALVGPAAVLSTFVFSAFLGGAIAVFVLVRAAGWWGLIGTVLTGWRGLLSPEMRTTRMTAFPFASAIFFGLFAALTVGA
jgi:prepilin peptidase CpaA